MSQTVATAGASDANPRYGLRSGTLQVPMASSDRTSKFTKFTESSRRFATYATSVNRSAAHANSRKRKTSHIDGDMPIRNTDEKQAFGIFAKFPVEVRREIWLHYFSACYSALCIIEDEDEWTNGGQDVDSADEEDDDDEDDDDEDDDDGDEEGDEDGDGDENDDGKADGDSSVKHKVKKTKAPAEQPAPIDPYPSLRLTSHAIRTEANPARLEVMYSSSTLLIKSSAGTDESASSFECKPNAPIAFIAHIRSRLPGQFNLTGPYLSLSTRKLSKDDQLNCRRIQRLTISVHLMDDFAPVAPEVRRLNDSDAAIPLRYDTFCEAMLSLKELTIDADYLTTEKARCGHIYYHCNKCPGCGSCPPMATTEQVVGAEKALKALVTPFLVVKSLRSIKLSNLSIVGRYGSATMTETVEEAMMEREVDWKDDTDAAARKIWYGYRVWGLIRKEGVAGCD